MIRVIWYARLAATVSGGVVLWPHLPIRCDVLAQPGLTPSGPANAEGAVIYSGNMEGVQYAQVDRLAEAAPDDALWEMACGEFWLVLPANTRGRLALRW